MFSTEASAPHRHRRHRHHRCQLGDALPRPRIRCHGNRSRARRRGGAAVLRRGCVAGGADAGPNARRLAGPPEVHLRPRSALADADFVQENAPERPELKVKLFAEIDDATPPEAIIASSSSGITMSVMQAECRRPERTVIGHPFNPPHVIPLVEVVGGTKTAPETIQDAMVFYASIGKKPIHLKKELPGHVANRLQSALYREVVYLIGQGVLDVADADDAVSWGPGLRWGVMGPNLLWHLGGGQGGIQHFMDHLMPRMAAGWPGLGNPELTPELAQQIIKGVLEEADGRSIEELAAERDEMLFGLLAVRGEYGSSPATNA